MQHAWLTQSRRCRWAVPERLKHSIHSPPGLETFAGLQSRCNWSGLPEGRGALPPVLRSDSSEWVTATRSGCFGLNGWKSTERNLQGSIHYALKRRRSIQSESLDPERDVWYTVSKLKLCSFNSTAVNHVTHPGSLRLESAFTVLMDMLIKHNVKKGLYNLSRWFSSLFILIARSITQSAVSTIKQKIVDACITKVKIRSLNKVQFAVTDWPIFESNIVQYQSL